MKCPECGQWNRASMPHCTNCGTPLNIDEASRLAWKDTLRDGGASVKYLRADEFGQIDATPEARDALADEMQELKKRKQEGAERQSRLSRSTVSRSDSEIVVTEEPSLRRETGQVSAVRVQTASRNDQALRIESENRHRVRYMNEKGTFTESRTYDPPLGGEYREGTGSWHLAGPLPSSTRIRPEKKHGFLKVLLVFFILAGLGAGGYFGYQYFAARHKPSVNQNAIVTASMMDDMAAHTILIPGEEGTTIYIRELHSSYVVVDGFATVEVADHTWYDNLEGSLEETMDVTLTPFLKTSSGRQTPLDHIVYPITIPISPIKLESPEALRTTVSTTMAAIKIVVRPGSRVTVNDVDCSDTVSSDTGEMSYNATVQPIGDNVFNIVVRSQYCRENSISVILYREPQEIPLDLAVGTYGTTDQKVMKVTATTLPGARVEVTTPYADLNITDLDSTGKFTFNAIFDKIGDNTITIKSSYPGMRTSEVNHVVYYLPPASEYTSKAWPLSADGYSELLSNMSVRIANSQVYVVKGVVQYSVSEKPQMVVINTSEDGKSQPVLVQN
ncbi:MAG: zinc ribbon domain-containing protein, partial [Clostridia bacterium]|nr:zinc ribbon domain-containing protein [Clostridia bacterium]